MDRVKPEQSAVWVSWRTVGGLRVGNEVAIKRSETEARHLGRTG